MSPDATTPEPLALSRWDDDGGRAAAEGGAGEPPTSGLIPTPPADPVAAERLTYRAFSCTDADPEYRGPLARCYRRWEEFNALHFGGVLAAPHIAIGRTAPRRFSGCRRTTDYGGAVAITLAEGVVFGTNPAVVRSPYPAAGLLRFVDDLLLGETVKQYVLEVCGTDEDGYGGYGPLYAAEATRIGAVLGLPPVGPRRRGFRGAGRPVAAFWPWAFRPAGYYLGHVRLGHRRVAGLRQYPAAPRVAAVPGVYEYFLYLLVTGRTARLTEILGREVDAAREARSPALAAAERNPLDAAGHPLPLPAIDPDWLAWNGGCVRAIAEGVRARRAFDGMPVLADALQDAGCDDGVLLGHLRSPAEHTANCWALRLLTGPQTP